MRKFETVFSQRKNRKKKSTAAVTVHEVFVCVAANMRNRATMKGEFSVIILCYYIDSKSPTSDGVI